MLKNFFASLEKSLKTLVHVCWSGKLLEMDSPSQSGSNVDGTMTYVPGLSLNLAETSLRLMNDFGFAVLAW